MCTGYYHRTDEEIKTQNEKDKAEKALEHLEFIKSHLGATFYTDRLPGGIVVIGVFNSNAEIVVSRVYLPKKPTMILPKIAVGDEITFTDQTWFKAPVGLDVVDRYTDKYYSTYEDGDDQGLVGKRMNEGWIDVEGLHPKLFEHNRWHEGRVRNCRDEEGGVGLELEFPRYVNRLVRGNFGVHGFHVYLYDETASAASYYASTKKCLGKTEWCSKHCYAKKYPAGFNETKYKLQDFTPAKNSDDASPLSEAKYLTFFGSGTLSEFDKPTPEVVTKLGTWYPEKKFLFNTREVMPDFTVPKNCTISFSADCTTIPELLEKALLSKTISVIAMVDHPDNAALIETVKGRVDGSMLCKNCINSIYSCYKRPFKKMLTINEFWA